MACENITRNLGCTTDVFASRVDTVDRTSSMKCLRRFIEDVTLKSYSVLFIYISS